MPRRYPWAGGAGDVAGYHVERALGDYSVACFVRWNFPDELNRLLLCFCPEDPDVWSDGSKGSNEVARFDSADAGGFARMSGDAWSCRVWGHVDSLALEGGVAVDRCGLFCSVAGPLQSVLRAQIWGVIILVQAAAAVHVRVYNLNVVRFIQGLSPCKPFQLLND